MFSSSLWLVIPCFNEEKRLPIEAIFRFLENSSKTHICMVDDGSCDATHDILLKIQQKHPCAVTVLKHQENKGKAEAVRTGILHGLSTSEANCVGYWDADLATPFRELQIFAREANDTPNWNILMGCRHQRLGTDIQRTISRHYLGRIFATFVSQILTIPVYDTQCGAKIFRADKALALFSLPFISPWIFDVEILARFLIIHGRCTALETIREVPLQHWYDIDGSKLSPMDYVASLMDLIKIKRNYSI
nr:glycosyltransferase [uncultured Pseudodesulfovibrio sp.]